MYNLNLDEILGNNRITLYEVLDGNEARAMFQQKMLSKYNMTLISFTLNIPGDIKTFPLAKKTFEEGKELIIRHLQRYNLSISGQKDNKTKTGFESFFAVDSDSLFIKRIMTEIENTILLGRVFDIDVIRASGEIISRKDIGADRRTCLICNEIAHVCSRNKRHSMEELIRKTLEIMTSYFNIKFANQVGSYSSMALMYEVMITPKPGLVDRANNGSHSDMNIFTFIDSSSILGPHFRDFVLTGIEFHKDEHVKLFERIRYLGMLAEDDMYQATKGVNTHKGLIFSLGIICTALGYLYGNNQIISVENVLKTSKAMTLELMDDFNNIKTKKYKTHGEKLYAMYGIKGIRQEVASGFESVRLYGLPTLRYLKDQGFSLNEAGALTLLNLIANVIDTNVIARSDIETSKKVQNNIKQMIDEIGIENIDMESISEIDKEFISLNISPGGCADLLAITYMLYYIDNYDLHK